MHEFLYTEAITSYANASKTEMVGLPDDFVELIAGTLDWIPWTDSGLETRHRFRPYHFDNVIDSRAASVATKVFNGWQALMEVAPGTIDLPYSVDLESRQWLRLDLDRDRVLVALKALSRAAQQVSCSGGYLQHFGI